MKILLIVASVTMFGKPYIDTAERDDWKACNAEAKAKMQSIKVSSARVWCAKVIDKKDSM